MKKTTYEALKGYTEGIKYMMGNYANKEHDAVLAILVALDALNEEIYALGRKKK